MRTITLFSALTIIAFLPLSIEVTGQEYRVIDGGAIGTNRGSTVIDVTKNGRTDTYIIDNWGTVGGRSGQEERTEERYRAPEPLDTSDLDFKPWKENP